MINSTSRQSQSRNYLSVFQESYRDIGGRRIFVGTLTFGPVNLRRTVRPLLSQNNIEVALQARRNSYSRDLPCELFHHLSSMTSIRLLLLVTALGLRGTEALSDCRSSVHNKTIAYFNSAPLAFSYELATALDCQHWCDKVPACQAWVYVDQSNQCDLHRTMALSVSDNTGFIFGGCKPSGIDGFRLAPTLRPSSHSTMPSTSLASDTATLVRSSLYRICYLGLIANEVFILKGPC